MQHVSALEAPRGVRLQAEGSNHGHCGLTAPQRFQDKSRPDRHEDVDREGSSHQPHPSALKVLGPEGLIKNQKHTKG